jgi:hypothetical protein
MRTDLQRHQKLHRCRDIRDMQMKAAPEVLLCLIDIVAESARFLTGSYYWCLHQVNLFQPSAVLMIHYVLSGG